MCNGKQLIPSEELGLVGFFFLFLFYASVGNLSFWK